MKKIYIIGPVGSGKTTFARSLSEILNIKTYELDKIVWDDEKKLRRNEDVITKMFLEVIGNKSWIIEDVGRKIFRDGIKEADIVYYISLNKITIYKRCIYRWIMQVFKLEKCDYKPTLKFLIQMLKWAKKDIENKNEKLDFIVKNSKKYQIINKGDIKNLLKNNDWSD